MKRLTLALLAAAMLLCVSARTRAASPAELPDSVAAVVEVTSIQEAMDSVDQLGRAVAAQPVPPQMLQKPLAQLLNITDQPVSEVLEMSHPLRLVILDPPRHATPVLLVKASDAQAYLDSVSADEQGDAPEGVRMLTLPLKAAGTIGDLLVMSREPQATADALQMLEDTVLVQEEPLYPDGQLTVEAKVSGIMSAVNEMPGKPLQKLKQMVKSQLARQDKNAQMAGEMFMAEVEALESLAGQTDSVVHSVSIGQHGIGLDCTITAAEGSGLSDYFSSLPAGPPTMLQHVPANSVVAFAGQHGNLEPLMKWYGEVMSGTLAASGMESAKVEDVMELYAQFYDHIGTEMGIGGVITENGKLRAVEAIDIRDPAKYRELYPQIEEMTAAMAEFQPGRVTMKVTADAEQHGGRSIDRWDMTLDLPTAEQVPADQVERMKKIRDLVLTTLLGGENPTMHSTFQGNTMLLTFGEDSSGMLKDVIDGKVKPLSESSEFTDRAADLLEDYDGAAYLSVTRLLEGMLRMVTGSDLQLPVPVQPNDLQFPDSPGIVMAYACSGRTGRMKVDIPAMEMQNVQMGVQSAVMNVMMRMQQQRQKQQSNQQ